MTQGERIKRVRIASGLSQEKFGELIKIRGASVSTIESGKSNAGDQTIELICNKFNVREDWLRTGAGEMSAPVDVEQELSEFLKDILVDESPDFRRALIHVLARMTEEEWAMLERKARELARELETPPPE